MILDYNTMEEQELPKFKGGEKSLFAKMFFDGSVRIMKGRLIPGATIGMHTHETNSEIVYILEGRAVMICDGENEELTPGMCSYCPKGHTHSLTNPFDEDVIFFAVVPEQ